MVMTIRVLRIVFAVIRVLFLIGAVLIVTGCSSPTTPSSSQSSVAVVPAGPGPSVPPNSSFWVEIQPNPIVMNVGSEASIKIDGSFDWYDLVPRVEPSDAFSIQRWGINIVNLRVLRRATGKLTVEVYGSGGRRATAVATIIVP